ncbi:MAG: TonB-dependent receptor [Xanthomonadales bacterium]|nr:TonB-dependent receptor [Xanthomonadales bacterium]
MPGHEHGDHGGPGRAGRRHAKNGDEHEVRIDLASNRYETRLGIDRPLDLIERVDWRLARGDYRHVELEDHDGETEIGTRFRVEGLDSRLDLRHRAFGDWQGVLGIQFGERRLRSAGEEPFVPAYRQRQVGVFLLERMTVGALALELGLRHENQRVHGAGERRRHRPFSLSLGLRHALSEAWHLHGALGRHQRAPFPEELLADGPHAATRAYERGDPTLGLETGHHAELGLHRHGERLELGASLFHTDYRGFIYLADTGEREAGLPVRHWTQAGARFSGLELEGALVLHEGDLGRWRLVAFADGVRARLKRGGWLPRIAPARQRLGLEWEAGTISAALRATRHARQERTAAGEEATPGFTLLDAELGWRLGGDRYRLVLAGRNLGDRVARLHHSYLRDQAPLPGRNLQLSLRASF